MRLYLVDLFYITLRIILLDFTLDVSKGEGDVVDYKYIIAVWEITFELFTK